MAPSATQRQFAIVTGASSGIGLELARCCAAAKYDLLIAAEGADIEGAAADLRKTGVCVDAVRADLATREGVEALYAAARGRPIDYLLANAGRGLGHGFLDQKWGEVQNVIDTNVTGTLRLIHQVGPGMRARGAGRILITGSIAGLIPGTYQAVYNGTKALLDSFSYALRAELEGSGVTVTCLMPGATETPFFEKAGMLDTKVGASKKADPKDVAKTGFDAMMAGAAHVVAGWDNKLLAAATRIATPKMLAERHGKMAAPGSANKS